MVRKKIITIKKFYMLLKITNVPHFIILSFKFNFNYLSSDLNWIMMTLKAFQDLRQPSSSDRSGQSYD